MAVGRAKHTTIIAKHASLWVQKLADVAVVRPVLMKEKEKISESPTWISIDGKAIQCRS
jgi:hypothetical protein